MLPSGGGIRAAGQFASGLAEHFCIDVHRPAGGSPLPAHLNMTETVHPYPLWRKPSGVLRTVAPVFLIARLLAFKRVCISIAAQINNTSDAALVHNTMPVAAPPLLNFLTIPSLYFCYEYPRHIYEQDIIRRTESPMADLALKPLEALEKRMDRRATADASGIATFSSYMDGRIHDIYGRNSSIVPPGVDTAFYSKDPDIARENFVLSVGALWPFKGHETAIKILSLIPVGERPVLRIVADREYPGYSKRLMAFADHLSVEIAIDLGISNTDLRNLYRSAKTVLCCQKMEPYGLVPLEAMACGTPVIAIAQGGFTDNIIHRRTGFLFDGTAEAGAEILSEITDSGSRGIVEEIAERGYEYVRRERNLQSGILRLTSVLEKL